MSAAEAMYFTGAPLAHVAAYDERKRLAGSIRRTQAAGRHHAPIAGNRTEERPMIQFFKRLLPRRKMTGNEAHAAGDAAYLKYAREFDWYESVYWSRVGAITLDEARQILAAPRAFDTLSVAAALRVAS